MKKFVLMAFAIFLGVGAFAADQKAMTQMDPKKEAMMKAWMQYATPGDEHKALAKLAGKWKYTSKMWETADAKPEESSGTSTMKMILGGRYLQQDFSGKAMGQPFQGMGFIGYNNLEKKYQSIWLDNMGTSPMNGTGSMDANTKTLTESGDYTCPMSSDKKREFRSEWKMIDDKNMTYTMYGPGPEDNKEFKQMEITYKRVR